ncbi:MAG: 23S rRNA (pseudouridine(1915)-N(3))-methyltransferase RlmH [Oscillospiraceae bacterium]|nr:23S rRNA (pseudouridine(1915)-N(3))-methyltransferase RlmH [Oscillospiraceae bacterium]
MNVNMIAVGKLKEEYFRMACGEYLKRLQAYCRSGVIEINETKLSQSPSEKEVSAALSAEGREMGRHLLGKDCFNIALCIEGVQLSSEEFSEKIAICGVNGKSTLNIIIGSSYGIAPEIKAAADFKLSASKMTFPHQMVRVMILEQLYRAFQILGGGKYHK